MTGPAARGALGALALAAALLAAAAPAAAQQSAEREIAESQRRLEQIRRERAELREDMSRIRARVHDLSAELQLLQRQVSTSAELLAEIEFQVAQREEQIVKNTRDLIGTQDLLLERRALLDRRLRDIYKRGPLHTTEVLLSARSFSDLLNRYRYLFLVARRDRTLVGEVARLETQLTSRERALRSSLLELQRLQDEREREYAELSELEARQMAALESARQQEVRTTQRMAQLEEDEKRLGELISTLERRRREAERARAARGAAPRSTSTLRTSDIGNLDWPVEGRLLYRFGRVTQPNGTVLRWNGIGIGASEGSAVQAVEAGTVVMAGPFEGYGPTVVLSHGGGYYSLYLYLAEIGVKEGATISKGQVLGTVGGAQTPEGPHLEFQIRAPGGQAVDPLNWLQKRGSR